MNQVNRINELNKTLFHLNRPKLGDTVKFKIEGREEIYEGVIRKLQTVENGNNVNYGLEIKGDTKPDMSGNHRILILECNGIKYPLSNGFEPI